MSAVASSLPPSLAVEPGGELVVPIRIRNPSPVVDEFSVRVAGEPEEWAEIDPPTIALFPNAEATVNVRLRPPRTSSTVPGVVPFAVIVSSAEHPEGTVAEEGLLTVGSFHHTAAELAPGTSRGRRRGQHKLAFDNFGNTPLSASLSGADKENALEFRFAPGTLTARPGTAAFSKVEVRARERLLTGPERMHLFQVLVEAPGPEERLVVDGAYVQRALFPRLLLPLALLVAGLALAWAFLKPDVESTAEMTTAAKQDQQTQEAAQDSAAAAKAASKATKTAATASSTADAASATATAAQKAASTAAKTASAASSNAGESASAAGEAATSIAKSLGQEVAGPIPGQPTSTRLSVKCPPRCKDAVKVPDGERWLLTDLVFGNPMADPGMVKLAVDGDVLFVQSLETFRDLGFQFTAPMLVEEGGKLKFRATCPDSTKNPPSRPPCTPGVYVAGFAQPVKE